MAGLGSWSSILPSGSVSISQGDDDIRANNAGLQEAWTDEHYFQDGSANSGGVHKAGSARIFSQSAAPIAVAPIGQLWHASDDDSLYVAEGAGTGNWTIVSSAAQTVLTGEVVWNIGNIASHAFESTLITVTGAAVGDLVVVSQPALADSFVNSVRAYVSATDTVTLVYQNQSLSASNPGSHTYKVRVYQ